MHLDLSAEIHLYKIMFIDLFPKVTSMKVKNIESYFLKVRSPLMDCRACSLHYTCLQKVPGEGIASKYWLIGEAPGAQEDIYGRPFVGKAGQTLDRMLDDADLSRDMFYVTNIVKCRPPNNRTPTPLEIRECNWNNLYKEISALKPKYIIPMGNTATRTILDYYVGSTAPNISRARSRVYRRKMAQVHPRPVADAIIPIFHPSYCLRNRLAYATTVDDFKKIKRLIETGNILVLFRTVEWYSNGTRLSRDGSKSYDM